MIDEKIGITDVWLKLREIDDKLDRVRGDVNVLATINKQRDRERLLELCKDKIGKSLDMQRLWYHAKTPKSISELCAISKVKLDTGGRYLRRLHERGMLVRNETVSPVTYVRSEVSEDIGVDKWIELNHKARSVTLQSAAASSVSTEENNGTSP